MRRHRLVDARKAAGKTQEDIAEHVGVDRTTVGKWERDESTPQPHQRPLYADALGVTLSELAAMLSSIPSDANEVPAWLSTYLGMEQSADLLRAHEPRCVHGLLQTPSYTAAIVGRVGVTGVSDTYVKQSVEQRRHRQGRVRDGSLSLEVIQPESALHLQVGDTAVMSEQLAALADLADLPNVTIRVTTYNAGQYEARRLGYFALLSHPWGNPIAYIEGYGGGRQITDADEVAYFSAAYDQALSIALPPAQSVEFIREVANRWEAKR